MKLLAITVAAMGLAFSSPADTVAPPAGCATCPNAETCLTVDLPVVGHVGPEVMTSAPRPALRVDTAPVRLARGVVHRAVCHRQDRVERRAERRQSRRAALFPRIHARRCRR